MAGGRGAGARACRHRLLPTSARRRRPGERSLSSSGDGDRHGTAAIDGVLPRRAVIPPPQPAAPNRQCRARTPRVRPSFSPRDPGLEVRRRRAPPGSRRNARHHAAGECLAICSSVVTSAEAHCHRQPRWGTRDGGDLQPEPAIHRHHRGLEVSDDGAGGGAAVGAADRDRDGRHSSAGR